MVQATRAKVEENSTGISLEDPRRGQIILAQAMKTQGEEIILVQATRAKGEGNSTGISLEDPRRGQIILEKP